MDQSNDFTRKNEMTCRNLENAESYGNQEIDPLERPDTWVTVCTGHIGDTSSPRGGSDALEGVFGYG